MVGGFVLLDQNMTKRNETINWIGFGMETMWNQRRKKGWIGMQTRRLDSPIVGLLVFHEATVRFSLSRVV